MSTHKSTTIPTHIAIIMDGNGRWAKSKFLPASAGHKKGANVAKNITRACKKLGVSYLTLFAFSSENWNRPKDEVEYLMNLLREYLKSDINELIQEDIKIKIIGDKSKLDKDIITLIDQVEEESKNNSFTLVLALSYGSRDEIRTAAFRMHEEIISSNLEASMLAPEYFDQFLYTKDIPDPDLLIRTSGEQRISNFLLWQIAYSELFFTNILWPDFSEKDLINAYEEFKKRDRRFGAR